MTMLRNHKTGIKVEVSPSDEPDKTYIGIVEQDKEQRHYIRFEDGTCFYPDKTDTVVILNDRKLPVYFK